MILSSTMRICSGSTPTPRGGGRAEERTERAGEPEEEGTATSDRALVLLEFEETDEMEPLEEAETSGGIGGVGSIVRVWMKKRKTAQCQLGTSGEGEVLA